MAQYSDNFDRANNASLGTDWSERPGQTDFVIDTNAVLLSGAGAEGLAIYQSAVDGNDQFARITVSSMTSGAFPGLLIARGSLASTDGFCVFINSSGVELVRFDTEATLGSYSRSYSAPETVELRRVGTTISVHLDGVQRISVTSSLFSSGRYGGINGYTDAGGDSLRLDDFVLGDYPPPSGGGGFQAAWARGANVILRAGR